MRKVFISHATSDKPIADLVEQLIETGIGIPHNEVFCTSLEGHGIPEGTPEFKEHIRKQLDGCDTVIALISENYYASPFCMCELGAVWILAKNFFPILISPITFKDLRGALHGTQCRELEHPATPSALYDHLSKLAPTPVPVARWDIKKDIFIKSVHSVAAKLPKPKTVSAEEHARIKIQSNEFRELSIQLQEEINTLKLQIAELSKAKDASAVAEIQRKYSTEWDEFEELRMACEKAIAKCSRVVREALYYWARNEPFAPNYQDWGDTIQLALENDELTRDPNAEYCLWPNRERPWIGSAIIAIDALRGFLDQKCSADFFNQAAARLGDTPDIKRRTFWDDHLL